MFDTPIFAGLGSNALFAQETIDTAMADLQVPEATLILKNCWHLFVQEVSTALEGGVLIHSSIDLRDFPCPESLVDPPKSYHSNVLVQHVSLYLIQTLRYISFRCVHSKTQSIATAGFCTGILPAAAVATSSSIFGFIFQARQVFCLALALGIHCAAYRLQSDLKRPCKGSAPWSLVVDGVSSSRANSILRAFKDHSPSNKYSDAPGIYVSAINSDQCVTISGHASDLRQIVDEQWFPSGVGFRTTNVHSAYHSRSSLKATYDDVMEQVSRGMTPADLQAPVSLFVPLISSIDGSVYTDDIRTLRNLFEVTLDSILLEPVSWVQVENRVLSIATANLTANGNTTCSLLNFGPGYGISRSRLRNGCAIELIDASAAGARKNLQIRNLSAYAEDDVAIVGMGVDLPDAEDSESLWQNLCSGYNSCKEVPESRFPIEEFSVQQNYVGSRSVRTMKTKFGNFLRNPFQFDNSFFNVSPREARSMDPQQRIMLQTAYRALEDSGYTPDASASFARESFGCFIGNATLDYTDNLKQDIDVYYSPGTLKAFQSGRISYVFGWSGPSMTLDTACSSSMVALHQAVRALSAGDCRAALVGGVNVITSPDMYLGLDRAHFLSPTGQCKAFDASADGYCRSEGCAAFVVKKLGDAVAENDRILGVIKGIDVNQSGNTHSITHPHAPTQAKLFDRLFAKTKIDPHSVSVVELHGTGTQAGDPEELESIRTALCKDRDPSNQIHLTSIKANIGHCEAASGGASLAKLLLMLEHGSIPAQVSLKNLNPKIGALGADGAVIDTCNVPWRSQGHPRVAMLNNFGAAGSNGALLLQEAPICGLQRSIMQESSQKPLHVGLSAKSKEALSILRDDVIRYLKSEQSRDLRLEDLAYTYTARRQLYDNRISVTTQNMSDLSSALAQATITTTSNLRDTRPNAVLLFSGQGSQYVGMGGDLMLQYPVFADTMHRCDQILRDLHLPGCLQVIQPVKHGSLQMQSTEVQQALQTAMFALQVALGRLLLSWNIRPTAVQGHSLGEYAALVIAGVLNLQDALMLVAKRAQLFMEFCNPYSTSMLAINAKRDDVVKVVHESTQFASLEISCNNSAYDCVVGGPVTQLQDFKQFMSDRFKVKSKMLHVPLAYHTEAVVPVMQRLTQIAECIDINPPQIPVVSNVFGRIVNVGEKAFEADYFARHCRETVLFDEGVEALTLADIPGVDTRWIEAGPSPMLLPMISTRLKGVSASFLPCLRKGVSAASTMSSLVSELYSNTNGINWRQVYCGYSSPQLIKGPRMPFLGKEFVVSYPRELQRATETPSRSPEVLPYKFLSTKIQDPNEANDQAAIYETRIDDIKEFITGHVVADHALCPASVYHELALSAASDSQKQDCTVRTISNVAYHKPLLFAKNSKLIIRITISSKRHPAADRLHFSISSRDSGATSKSFAVHCEGLIKTKNASATLSKHARTMPSLKHKISLFTRESEIATQQTFFNRTMYEVVFPRVVSYSTLYRSVKCIRVDRDMSEAFAQCELTATAGLDASSLKSVLMDTLLHVAGFVANLRASEGDAYICKELSAAVVLQEPSDSASPFSIYCTTFDNVEGQSTVSDAFAVNANGMVASFKGMVFQKVKLAKIVQAFQLLSGSTTASLDLENHRPELDRVKSLTSGPGEVPMQKQVASAFTFADTKSILARICDVDPNDIDGKTKLEALGVDSLLMTELESQLYTNTNIVVKSSALSECRTVADLQHLISHTSSNMSIEPTRQQTPLDAFKPSAERTEDTNASVIAALISEISGAEVSTIGSHSSLDALGIDSLMFLELESRIGTIPGATSFSSSELSSCRTIKDVEQLVMPKTDTPATARLAQPSGLSRTRSSGRSAMNSSIMTSSAASSLDSPATSYEPIEDIPEITIAALEAPLGLLQQPECIQTPKANDPSGSPLMLVHDGSGVCLHYRRLRPLNRAVHAIHDPRLMSPHDWSSLTEMAESYASITEATCGSESGSVILAGWSYGGVVAFEAACRLIARGTSVAGVILIDSPPPIHHQPLSEEIIAHVVGNTIKTTRANDTSNAVRKYTSRNFARCAALLASFVPNEPTERQTPRTILLRSQAGYQNPELRGDLNPWLQDRSDPRSSVEGWEKVTGGSVDMMDIPGNHFEAFDGINIDAVSAQILEACKRLEAQKTKRT